MVGTEQERRQVRRDVGEGQHVGMKGDSERVAHESPSCLDPLPRGRVLRRELPTQHIVGERDPVFDVRREVLGPGRRNHVDLQRHPGPQLDG